MPRARAGALAQKVSKDTSCQDKIKRGKRLNRVELKSSGAELIKCYKYKEINKQYYVFPYLVMLPLKILSSSWQSARIIFEDVLSSSLHVNFHVVLPV